MRQLEVRINEVEYLGLLNHPAFSLWDEGKILLAALYNSFRPFNVKLADITIGGDATSPANQDVSVRLGSGASFKFRFDRLEARLANYTESDLVRFPEIVRAGVSGIREAATDITFASHIVNSASHSLISGVSSREFLLSLPSQPKFGVGQSMGHGHIFHFAMKDGTWQVQFSIDHSLSVPGGLYVSFLIVISTPDLDYGQIFTDAREVYRQCLAEVGLQLVPTT